MLGSSSVVAQLAASPEVLSSMKQDDIGGVRNRPEKYTEAYGPVARQQRARQWTGWKAVFSAGFAPMAAYATMNTTMGTVFSVLSVPKCYKQFCMRFCEGRT
jgi:hypothetical protein